MQRVKYKLWSCRNMKLLNEFWEDYKIHMEEYTEHTEDCDDDYCPSDTEMLFEFIDNYTIETSTNLVLLGELLLSNHVALEDIEGCIKHSESLAQLTFLLAEHYIYGRIDHEERQKELDKQIETIDQKRKKKFLYADFVDEDDI